MHDATAPTGVALKLPWGAWYGDLDHELAVPDEWTLEPLQMADAPALAASAVEAALDDPIGAPRLEELAKGVTTAVIAVDDLTRPTPTAALLAPLTRRLERAGLSRGNIRIVVASGAHRRMSTQDMVPKVGRDVLDRFEVVQHDPNEGLLDTGVALAGASVRLNRTFVQAELRLGIGCVIPHPFAAFSGGGKLVIPGLADLDTLARTHRFALMGLKGGRALQENTFRAEMERAVRRIGLHWTVNVVVNSRRETAYLGAGDLVEAHRAAARFAGEMGSTPGPARPLDALILNAYPKDGELLQIEGAFVALRSGMLEWLSPGAPVVLAASCLGGVGEHALFQPGGRLFRVPSRKTFLGDHPLIVFSPAIDERQARTMFWSGYPFYRSWDDVIVDLRGRLRPHPHVGVVPCAPLQLAR